MSNAQNASALAVPYRLAAASPALILGDPMANADGVIQCILRADELCADFLALPELCLTGATLGSLFSHPAVLQAAQTALKRVCAAVKHTRVTVTVGLPYLINGSVYSCAALIRGDRVYAILPAGAASPFGFSAALEGAGPSSALTPVPGLSVEFGGSLYKKSQAKPGGVILMPSRFNATAGSFRQVKAALRHYSARTGAAVAYAAPNQGESGTNFVFDGMCAIAAGGELLSVSEPLSSDAFVFADVDAGALFPFEPFVEPQDKLETYLPRDGALEAAECDRILDLQAAALGRRLTHIHGKGFVIGVSGGLDSALALLASAAAADRLGLPRTSVLGVSMPGFGTTSRTKNNSLALCQALGCAVREISVVPACKQHFLDIGHDEAVHDTVFENAQARERTKILLSIANGEGLLDVGTGDLSEAALGWTTFAGDHMAQYGVNASLPKTVVRKVTARAMTRFPEAAEVLADILNTPVSPELLPAKDGEIAQKTEELIGSYELHDFFLYHMLVNKKSPQALYDMAVERLDFPPKEAYRVLGIFLKRFFAQQFKRNCAPEAPAILLSIAPAAFTMPSDMSAAIWMDEYNKIGDK